MARAETIENVGEATVAVTCRPWPPGPVGPDPAWPGLLAATRPLTGTCRSFCSQSRAPSSPPHEEWPNHLSPPSGPLNQPPRDVMDPASAFSAESSGPCRLRPLPDLLPLAPNPPVRAEENALDIRRVATQLRSIGDQFHADVAARERGAPYWPDMEEACRGLLNFLAQTLSAVCRLM